MTATGSSKGSNKTDLSSTDLTFKVNAKEIGILYGKYTKAGCSADVYIDDELAITLNADFTGGWGNYVECAQIKSFDAAGEHTVKIVPKTTDGSERIQRDCIGNRLNYYL